MRDMIQDPKSITENPRPINRKRLWRKLIWLLLLGGLGAGSIQLGPQFYQWAKNYQCAKNSIKDKNADQSYQCLERIGARAANFFTRIGFDIRQLYLDVINQRFAAGQYLKALAASESGWKKFSWEPAFRMDQALALFHMGHILEAAAILEEMLNSPQFEQLRQVNGVRMEIMAAQIYLAAQKIEEAEKYLKQVLEKDPDNLSAHLLYARLEAFRQNMDRMVEHYQKVIGNKSEPMVWQDLFLLAVHYLNTGQIEKFQLVFAQSRRDYPNASGFHLLLAIKFLKDQNFASAYYEVLLEKEVGLADASFFKEAIDKIESIYASAFTNQPAEPWLLPLYQFIQGKSAYEKKDYVRAFAWIGQSLNRAEIHPLQQLYMGRAAAGAGRLEEAMGYYGMALNKQETLAKATAEFAQLYFQKGKIEPAKNLWQKAVSSDPFVVRLFDLGTKLAEMDSQFVQAELSFQAAQKMADQLMRDELNKMMLSQFIKNFQTAAAAHP